MNKAIGFIILSLVLVLTLNVASANTIVTGTIYNEHATDEISNATVTVTCGDTIPYISEEDGTYAVSFNESVCPLGSEAKVVATKDGYSSAENNAYVYNISNSTDFFSVINLKLIQNPTPTSSPSGSKGKYYRCGNGICDSGETYSTCSKDCTIEPVETVNLTALSTNITNPTQNETAPEETSNGITGAVIGALSTGLSYWIIVILVVLVIGFFVVRRILAHKK